MSVGSSSDSCEAPLSPGRSDGESQDIFDELHALYLRRLLAEFWGTLEKWNLYCDRIVHWLAIEVGPDYAEMWRLSHTPTVMAERLEANLNRDWMCVWDWWVGGGYRGTGGEVGRRNTMRRRIRAAYLDTRNRDTVHV